VKKKKNQEKSKKGGVLEHSAPGRGRRGKNPEKTSIRKKAMVQRQKGEARKTRSKGPPKRGWGGWVWGFGGVARSSSVAKRRLGERHAHTVLTSVLPEKPEETKRPSVTGVCFLKLGKKGFREAMSSAKKRSPPGRQLSAGDAPAAPKKSGSRRRGGEW